MGEISKELIDCVDKEEIKFKTALFRALIINWMMIVSSTTVFVSHIKTIYLIWGIVGTVCVGSSGYYSKKAIIGYSSTKVDYNPDVVDTLSKSRLWTSIGTICLFCTYILGYMM